MSRDTVSSEFLVGYIQARMEQLRSIAHRLDSRSDFSSHELKYIREEMLDIDLEVHTQSKFIKEDQLNASMPEYKQLHQKAERAWDARKTECDLTEKVDAAVAARAPSLQFGDVDMTIFEDDDSQEDTMAVEVLSQVTVTRTFEPVEFVQCKPPVRAIVKEVNGRRRAVAFTNRPREEATPPERRRIPFEPPPASFKPYVSKQQAKFSRAISGIPYPPMRRSSPYKIVRGDPTLIGRSEIFVYPPSDARICPLCRREHKMYRCPDMLSSNLQDKWFHALSQGVCLNCMIRGHSTFTCRDDGACKTCHCRHNSILCPNNQNNW